VVLVLLVPLRWSLPQQQQQQGVGLRLLLSSQRETE
jgi:hypothetical protein